VLTFLKGARDLKKAETQLMTIRGLADRRHAKLTIVARVRELIRANQRLTTRELSVEVGVSYGTCQTILKQDLNMRRVADKICSANSHRLTEGMALVCGSKHGAGSTVG